MVTQNFQAREAAEIEADRLRAIGIPVSVLRVRVVHNDQVERVWQVVVPHDYAAFAGCEVHATIDEDGSD